MILPKRSSFSSRLIDTFYGEEGEAAEGDVTVARLHFNFDFVVLYCTGTAIPR